MFFFLQKIRYKLLLSDLVRYTEKGLDILTKRSGGGGVGVGGDAAGVDKLKASLQEEVETLSRALHIMTVVLKMANDMMMVGHLQGFDVSSFLSFLFFSFLVSARFPIENTHRPGYITPKLPPHPHPSSLG